MNTNWTTDYKIIFFLVLSEKIILTFSKEKDRIKAREVIDLCWKWIETKEISGESLYDLLDNEKTGITLIQELSDNKNDISVWNCIIDAVAYTSRKAYEYEGIEYFPQPIELVDDNISNHFIDCLGVNLPDIGYFCPNQPNVSIRILKYYCCL